MENRDILTAYFASYETGNWELMERLLHENFEFSSPHDPSLRIPEYYQKCWPFHKKAKKYHFESVVESGQELWVIYTCETNEGNTFRNAEYFLMEGKRIKKVRVFYGTLG